MQFKLFLVFLFFFFASSVFSEVQNTSIDQLDFAYGLNYTIEITPKNLSTSPTTIFVTIRIFNNYEKDLTIYLFSKKGEKYEIEQLLGTAPKNKFSVFKFSYVAEYQSKKFSTKNYALLAKGYEVPLGFYFDIKEDWSNYEKSKYLEILNNAKFLIPFGGFILVVLISFIALISFFSYQKQNSFKLYNFLFSDLKYFNKELFISSPVFWFIYILSLSLGFWFLFNISEGIEKGWLTFFLLSFLIALSIPILFFCLIWLYSFFIQKISFKYLIGSFFWGAVIAFLSLLFNSFAFFLLNTSETFIIFLFVSFFIPLTEEFLKGLGLFFLFDKKTFRAFDGLIYGFSIGLGFAFIENWFSFSITSSPLLLGSFSWASLFFYKSFFGSLAHCCFSGFFGFSLFWLKEKFSNFYSFILFLNALILPFIFHSLFNLTSSLDSLASLEKGFFYFFYNPFFVLILLGINLILLFFSTLQKKYLK